jgi:LacI family transcriptional regulator
MNGFPVKPMTYTDHVANIHDVAKEAGVSATTAKRAIRQPRLLAPATLERVKRAIETLHYEPDQTAGALRRGRSNTVGLMVGNIVEPFFATLTRTVARAVRARGYALLIADSEYRSDIELENLKMFYGQRVSGLLLRSSFGGSNLDYLLRMKERGTYILEMDYFYPDSPFGHVMLANEGCTFEGVRYLYELGHRRIAALTAYDPLKNPEERSRAFPEAMETFGLALPEAYTHVLNISDPAEAYAFTLELMRLSEPPTALFALTGNQAMGAFRALKELHLRVPEDVSLLTFDNYPWTELVDPPLDVIEQPVEAMSLAAVELLLAGIEQRAPDRVMRRRFPGKLIRRGSCAPPRVYSGSSFS